MKLVVGLGNPGKEYNLTRHNVGFIILDKYLGDINWSSKFNGLYYEKNINNEKVIFVKPQSYMNLSGNVVQKFINFYKIDSKDLLVIHDDLDLPVGKFRIKINSSSGGHNGIKDIISCLNTNEFVRLKIGISQNRNIDTKDYVLGHFNKDDLKLFEEKTQVFNNIINDFISQDINYCMANYNRK